MKSEIYLFIIWEKARENVKEVFENIKKKFEIWQVYEITWNPNNFEKNLRKFYGATLPDPLRKIEQVGIGAFLLVIVIDKNPIHGKRRTSMGKQIVNTNIYDAKKEFRKFLGGGFPIHGSIHEKESNHDLTLLLGKNLEQISKELKTSWNGETKKIKADLVGINGWSNLQELFFVLNNTTNYVVLRNHEKILNNQIDEKIEDIDLLTDDELQIPYILGKQLSKNKKHNFPFVEVDKKFIKFDIKYVGGTYLDEKWSRNILDNKLIKSNMIYVPKNEDYFYTLIHHIVVQKTKMRDNYKKSLINLSKNLDLDNFEDSNLDRKNLKQILNKFMTKNGYRYTYSPRYKIKHNEFLRLTRVCIRLAKSDGIKEVLRASKGKMKRMYR